MKFDAKQKRYLIKLIELIFACEVLLKIDNKIIQTFGVLLVPIIVGYGYLFLRRDQNNIE